MAVLLALLVWFGSREVWRAESAGWRARTENRPGRAEISSPPAASAKPGQEADATISASLPSSAPVLRVERQVELRAYRIAVRGGVLALDGVEPVFGDFHRRRGTLPWMSGMWCVRLLDENLQVVAEDTAKAPDDVCVVLDPQRRDGGGNPLATQYAGAGEEAVLQFRLPPHPEAKWLKVYSLTSANRADWKTEPDGKLLASFPL